MEGLGFSFAISFSNEYSAPAFRKLENAYELFHSRAFYLPIGSQNLLEQLLPKSTGLRRVLEPLASLVTRSRVLFIKTKYQLKELDAFDERCEEWGRSLAAGYFLSAHRSIGFLEWKAKKIPEELAPSTFSYWIQHEGRQLGYCILFIEKRRRLLKILDCVTEDPESHLVPALKAIIGFGVAQGCDGIVTNASTELYHRSLRAVGFLAGKHLRFNLVQGTLSIPVEAVNQHLYHIAPIDRAHHEY